MKLVDEDQVLFSSRPITFRLYWTDCWLAVSKAYGLVAQLAREYQLRYLNIVESDLAHRFGELKAA